MVFSLVNLWSSVSWNCGVVYVSYGASAPCTHLTGGTLVKDSWGPTWSLIWTEEKGYR